MPDLAGVLFILQAYLGQLVWPDFTSYPKTETAFMDVCGATGWRKPAIPPGLVCSHGGWHRQRVNGQASRVRACCWDGACGAIVLRGAANAAHFCLCASQVFDSHVWHPLHGVVTPRRRVLLSFQLAAEAINFGALIGLMAVNLSVLSHYFLKRGERRGLAIFSNLLIPR